MTVLKDRIDCGIRERLRAGEPRDGQAVPEIGGRILERQMVQVIP